MIKLLRGIPEINGKKVFTSDEMPDGDALSVDWEEYGVKKHESDIFVDFDENRISFKMVEKPEDADARRAHVDDLIAVALTLIDNVKGCEGNFHTALKLQEALHWQAATATRLDAFDVLLKEARAKAQVEKDKEDALNAEIEEALKLFEDEELPVDCGKGCRKDDEECPCEERINLNKVKEDEQVEMDLPVEEETLKEVLTEAFE